MLPLVYLTRVERSDQGTFGIWSVPLYGYKRWCLELPWKDNKQRISCIPPGRYIVKIRKSPKFGTIFHLQDVEGRSYILIHWGNYAGDVSKGWRTRSAGCLILGQKKGYLANQKAVLNSRITVNEFMRLMGNNTFELIITERRIAA